MPFHVYAAEITIHGVVFFSSRVYPAGGKARGTAEEAAPVLHNYALIYAFNGRPVEAYAVKPSLHYGSYQGRPLLRYPLVEAALACVTAGEAGECPVYAYPAAPVHVVPVKLFFSARTDSYAEYRGRLKNVAPRTVTLIGLGPGSRLLALLISARELPRRVYTRLGMKRTGALTADLYEARVEPYGEGYSSHPVNIGDVERWGLEAMDETVVLETRSPPAFDGSICYKCTRIGYVRTRQLYRVAWRSGGRERSVLVPLPPAVAAELAAGEKRGPRIEPAW